jgi:hypothetical protein
MKYLYTVIVVKIKLQLIHNFPSYIIIPKQKTGEDDQSHLFFVVLNITYFLIMRR